MLANNRVVWLDNTTLKDLSTKLNNFFSDTQVIDYDASTDKIYIGSDVPFNHRYFYVSVVNAVACVPTIEIWDGSSWVAVVDVIDQTSLLGVPFAQSGILSWTTNRTKTWVRAASTEDMTGSGLTSLKVYNMYWTRISYSVSLTGTFALKFIGHKFSKDEDLAGYYPDLNRSNVKTAFATGKTTWDDQHIMAAEEIFNYLRKNRVLWAKGQIFEWEPFTMPAVHKVAQIVYTAFGEDYDGRRDEALEKFNESMESIMGQGIDLNEDGHKSDEEHRGFSRSLVRR